MKDTLKCPQCGKPVASDDATEIGVFNQENLPHPSAFDHLRIIEDFFGRVYE